MDGTPRSLEDLRREIDELDAGLHDLLMRRAAVVAEVAASKSRSGQAMAYRPDREAQILRRLIARHDHRLPNSVVVRVWREILGATTRLQGTFRVAVPRAEDALGLWALAREHYGADVSLSTHGSPLQIINAVSEGGAEVGVVPWPTFEEASPWWSRLLERGDSVPRIVGRLPFLRRPIDTGHDPVDAFVVGSFDRGQSGADRSLIALDCGAETSRGAVHDAIATAGLDLGLHAIWETRVGNSDTRWHLVDIKGYVSDADDQLDDISVALGTGLRGARVIGGYATPVEAAAPPN